MIRSNKEIFIEKSIKVWGNKYDYSLVDYVSARKKVKIIYNDWIFEQSPDNHLRGKECEKTWTTERFIYESNKIHNGKYDYSLVDYKNMSTHVKIILDGVVYLQSPEKHLMGREVEKGFKLKTNEEFIVESNKIWGDKYDYSLVDYKGAGVPVSIIYKGIVYSQSPTCHLQGFKCETDSIRSTDDFIRKAISKHGNKYDYSLVDYKGTQNKIKIIYKGEVFEQKAGAHLYSNGLVERVIKKKTTESFINEAEQIHDFKFDYSKVNYVNSQTKVIIICPLHGEFNQIPSSHLQGTGCTFCTESSGEKEIAKFLKKNNINYSREHRFNRCVGKKRKLPFDFYIPSMRTCIEFDGIQHYQPVEYFGGLSAYESLKTNDKIKSDYCEENFINLIRIKYTDIDNIDKILYENLKVFMKSKNNI